MLSIFLSVLKIIGFVLLGIIGLVLLILFIVLFVPFRYKLCIDKDKDDGFEIRVKGVVSFLLHLLNVHIDYPSDPLYYVRVSIFKIFPRKEKKTEKIKKKSRFSKKVNEEQETEEFSFTNESSSDFSFDTEEDVSLGDESFLNDSGKEDEKKESLKDFCQKLIEFIKSFREKITRIYFKIQDIKNDFDYYLGIINSNTFNHAFSKCKKELIKLIRHIIPKSVNGYVEFGGKEPSLTAQVFGAFSAFRTRAFRKFKLIPFLNEEKFNGHVVIKGHFCLITILIIVIRVYFNRDIKRTLKMFKKER